MQEVARWQGCLYLTLEFFPEGWLQNGPGDLSGSLLGDLDFSCGTQLSLLSSFLSLFLLHQKAEGLQGREEQFLPLLDPCLPAGLVALHNLLVEGQVDMCRYRLCPELPVALGFLLTLSLGLLLLMLKGSRGSQPLGLLPGLTQRHAEWLRHSDGRCPGAAASVLGGSPGA